MLNAIKEITAWQIKSGNAAQPYSDFLESSFQIEEALEGFDLTSYEEGINRGDGRGLQGPPTIGPKEISRYIIRQAEGTVPDVDRLDKACDAIVFAIGSMAKLGLDHHGITKALNIVNKANTAKLGMPRDEHGKLLKPADFVGPEPELQALLDAIK